MTSVIHINGWPGSGKRSIGKILAANMGGRLLDNHAMLNPAEALFERSDPLHLELHQAVRDITFDYAARVAPTVPIVLTDPLSDDAHDTSVFERFRALAVRRKARLVAVTLDIDLAENVRRLESPDRADHRKLTRADVLMDLQRRYRLLRPEGAEVFSLDVTRLTAAEAAGRIANWLRES